MALIIGTKELKAVLRSYRPECRTYPASQSSNAVVYIDLDVGEFMLDSEGNIRKGPHGELMFKDMVTKHFILNSHQFARYMNDKINDPTYQLKQTDFKDESVPAPDGIDPVSWALHVADHNASLPWEMCAKWAVDKGVWML
jgi:hypothetical protein